METRGVGCQCADVGDLRRAHYTHTANAIARRDGVKRGAKRFTCDLYDLCSGDQQPDTAGLRHADTRAIPNGDTHRRACGLQYSHTDRHACTHSYTDAQCDANSCSITNS